MTYRDGPLCINSFYCSLYDYNSIRTYVNGQLELALAVQSIALHGSGCSSASLPLSPEGTALRSPWIGASRLARLGDGSNTPAGSASACLAAALTVRHRKMTMNPAPCTCLDMARTWLTNFVTCSNSVWDSRAVPFIPSCACQR